MDTGIGASVGKRMPQVAAENEQLKREIEHCFKSVADLEQRLVTIIKPETPKPTSEIKETSQATVPFAVDLRVSVDRVRVLGNSISSIINRLEI